jgi:Leucine-rich repeat (LRR) protein
MSSYVISANNSTGSASTTITFEVIIQRPGTPSVPTTIVLIQGDPMNPITPSALGIVDSWSINPTVPAGLTFNTTTGTISGTPTTLQAATNYTLTATNTTGSSTRVISIAIVPPPPRNLSYGGPYVGIQNSPLTPIVPTYTGTVSSFENIGPALPAGLTLLWSHTNQFTALPDLPAGLTEFACDYNQLTALPDLPAGLTGFACDHNQLTALPDLPAGLTTMTCSQNQLTSLPDLPAGLTILWCDHNQLTSLPDLPAGLIRFECDHNMFPPDLQAILDQYDDDLPQLIVSVNYYNAEQRRRRALRQEGRNIFTMRSLLSALPNNAYRTSNVFRKTLKNLKRNYNSYGPRKQRKSRKHHRHLRKTRRHK